MQSSTNQHENAAEVGTALNEHLPALQRVVATTNGAERAFKTTPRARHGFDDQDAAEDGLASLRYFLEEAIKQVRRVERALVRRGT